ncbi:Uncharacterized protein BN1224_CV14_A_01290 [Chlamydia pneumoniae]|uniref:Uncharacterized protein n=1 Tax=Chlamydia pneumoniae TaxID=83558 RepID=Q9K223_CHLPN|nr:hypothetical protein CP_0647 [Chlamydia pneumoniae AR39]CRI32623.1 Uncharacterized protein BN1224_Wien1_A_01300 [Chlamydia pneumoniae]CRI35484.1 Uncharacterized protein BN1224_CM1_A_01310 [Chlamydia pneumoniae]CRI36610.1 Uncharacterized protein BN1224_CV14_A_01290 [Chlamydia pneumoniae]CRI37736.1 Uncharacterized protein BN1224_CV15_B_00590 [Chlamydia pneumoniae]
MVLNLDITLALKFEPSPALRSLSEAESKVQTFAIGLLVIGILILLHGIIFFLWSYF